MLHRLATGPTRGILFVAFGRPHLAMAVASPQWLKDHSPNISAAVVTNVCHGPPDPSQLPRDTWSHVVADNNTNRHYKTQAHRHSPFDRTVMIDCDTRVVYPVDELFDYLDHWDAAMQLMGLRIGYKYADSEVLGGRRIGDLPMWNS